MSSPLLSVRDLRVEIPSRRGTVKAVDGISFDLLERDSFGLVGESGCGKSITLRAIMRLLPSGARVTSGQVFFGEIDLLRLDEPAMRDMRGRSLSMIFQEPMTALNPVMTVIDQIAEGPLAHLGYPHKQATERALELMRLVGIPDAQRRASAYPHELSGGMRQRVMAAIALACEPRIVLCDEPTTALDVTIQDQILKLLLRLQEAEGVGLAFVTHDLAVVAQMCRQVAVMYAGLIVETGSVQDVFRNPAHPYTLGLLRAVPDFDKVKAILDAIPGIPPDLTEPLDGCRFRPRCQFAQDDCSTGEFPLQPLVGDRATACIHWTVCREAVRADPVITEDDVTRG